MCRGGDAEYIATLYNDSSEDVCIKHVDRIVRLITIAFLPIKFNEVDKLSGTNGEIRFLTVQDDNSYT